MLLDWYYKIWVDCIIKMKSIPANKSDWEYKCMAFMSMAMALQYGVFFTLFEKYISHTDWYNLDIDILPGKNLDAFLSFFILFLLPFLILNYFLIFWRDRYKMLIEKYENNEGNYAIAYVLGTFILGLIFAISLFIYLSIIK